MIKSLTFLNYLIPFTVLLFIKKDFTLYIYAFLASFVVYRFLSNCIDIYPKNRNKIILILRDIMAELFIVFLILYDSKYTENYIIFGVLFITLFLITQIKSTNKIISFMIGYLPFDVPIVLWAIFQISLGNYLVASIFVAYVGWIYWYVVGNNNIASLYAYAAWNTGLMCTVLSLSYKVVSVN